MTVLDKLRKTHPRIREIKEIAGQYEIHIEGVPNVLKIKIVSTGDGFTGVANLAVQGKNAPTPYRCIHVRDTREEALEDAVCGFFTFLYEGSKIVEIDDW